MSGKALAAQLYGSSWTAGSMRVVWNGAWYQLEIIPDTLADPCADSRTLNGSNNLSVIINIYSLSAKTYSVAVASTPDNVEVKFRQVTSSTSSHLDFAVSGGMTITSISGGKVTGTMQASAGATENIAGDFSAPVCCGAWAVTPPDPICGS
jgi:hypothetical protein